MGSTSTEVLEVISYSFFQTVLENFAHATVKHNFPWLQHKKNLGSKNIELFLLVSSSKENLLILFGGKSSNREGVSEWKDLQEGWL